MNKGGAGENLLHVVGERVRGKSTLMGAIGADSDLRDL